MSTIRLKRSTTSGSTPALGDLDFGELALNIADGKLFFKNASDSSVFEFDVTSSYSVDGHNHAIADVTGLQSALDSKSNTGHSHVVADITGIDSYTGFDSRYYTETEVDNIVAGYIPLTQKASANGVASLDANGLIPVTQLPSLSISEVFIVGNETEQLALNAQSGDVAIRSDIEQNFIHNGGSAGTMADWTALAMPSDAVSSVDGRTGTVTLSDLYAPLSHTHAISEITNLQTELSNRSLTGHSHSISDITSLQSSLDDKSNVGHSHAWSEIIDKPSTFTPDAHTHSISEVTDFDPSTKADLSGAEFTGIITASVNTTYPLVLDSNGVNQGAIGIEFSGNPSQSGYLTADHRDSQSEGGGYSFHFTSTELVTNVILDSPDGNYFVGSNPVYHEGNLSSQSILWTGTHNFNTDSNGRPLEISRTGSPTSQVLKIGVDDRVTRFRYIEDTTSEGNGNFGAFTFTLAGNDGETDFNVIEMFKDKVNVRTGLDMNGYAIQNVPQLEHSGIISIRPEGTGTDKVQFKLNSMDFVSNYDLNFVNSNLSNVQQLRLYNQDTSAVQYKSVSSNPNGSDDLQIIPYIASATYSVGSNNQVGTLAIKLPTGRLWSSSMIRFTVDIYDYKNDETFSIVVGGYNYNTGNWVSESATQIGGKTKHTVRFGDDGTRNIIWIGDTSYSWSYVKAIVRDVQIGFSGRSDQWLSGWEISLDSTFGTVDRTIEPKDYVEKLEFSTGSFFTGSTNGVNLYGGSSTTDINIRSNNGTIRTRIYAESSGKYGFLKSDNSWKIRCASSEVSFFGNETGPTNQSYLSFNQRDGTRNGYIGIFSDQNQNMYFWSDTGHNMFMSPVGYYNRFYYGATEKVRIGDSSTNFYHHLDMNGNQIYEVGELKLNAGASITSAYNQDDILKCHSNGNITLSATGGNLYLGYNNTGNVLAASNIVPTSDGTRSLGNSSTAFASGYINTVVSDRLNINEIRSDSLGHIILNAGESVSYAGTQTGEYVYVNAESGIMLSTSPDNWASGWANREVLNIRGNELRFNDSTDTVLSNNGNYIRWTSPNGYVDIGANNSNYCHFYTDMPRYFFDTTISVLGGIEPHSSGLDLGTSTDVWSKAFINSIQELNDENALIFDDGDARITIHDGYGNFNLKSGVDHNNVVNGGQDNGTHIRMDSGGTLRLITYTGSIGNTASEAQGIYMGTGSSIDFKFNEATFAKIGESESLFTDRIVIHSTGDAVLKLEADSDNATETDNAYIEFSQDGGAIKSFFGFNESIMSGNKIGLWNGNGDAVMSVAYSSTTVNFPGKIQEGGVDLDDKYQKKITVSASAPSNPSVGDIWIET